jgi:hypothetical protein
MKKKKKIWKSGKRIHLAKGLEWNGRPNMKEVAKQNATKNVDKKKEDRRTE